MVNNLSEHPLPAGNAAMKSEKKGWCRKHRMVAVGYPNAADSNRKLAKDIRTGKFLNEITFVRALGQARGGLAQHKVAYKLNTEHNQNLRTRF